MMDAEFNDEVIGDALDQENGLTLILDSRGNPDLGQYPNISVYGVPSESVRVSSLRDASRKAREYIELHDLGGGNWTGGDVLDGSGLIVARISYNGRVWQAEYREDKSSPCRP